MQQSKHISKGKIRNFFQDIHNDLEKMKCEIPYLFDDDEYQYFTPNTSSSDIPAIQLNFQEEVKFILRRVTQSTIYLIERLIELGIPTEKPKDD